MPSVVRIPEEVTVFNPGERVKVNVNEEQLKTLQEGHGGWNPRMVQVTVITLDPYCTLIKLII